MLGTFRHLAGLAAVQVGDPSVSILEAGAQSDFRNTQEILKAQAWVDIGNRTGPELDATGASIGRPRLAATRAQGVVTITDPSFARVSGALASGVISGATVLVLTEEGSFPASGSVYVGRESGAEEGPFTFTRSGLFVTLGSALADYHQAGEEVVLAQGGARPILVGTVVMTSPNAAGGQIRFRTTAPATITDGEVEVTDVPVECQQVGVVGNVQRGAISAFATAPFSGAQVTNPLKFTSGRAVERDDDYREALKTAKDDSTKATATAIVSKVLGAQSTDEAGTVTSAVVTTRFGEKTIVVDDGTGYQNKAAGEAYEVLSASAIGGEDSFGLTNRPVSAAFVSPTITSWVPVADSVLAIAVDDAVCEIAFAANDFASSTAATAEELVAAINTANTLVFAQQSGSTFLVSPRTGASIRVVDGGANDWLKFPTTTVRPLRLYKNGTLLTQTGSVPFVESMEHGSWASVATGVTLNVTVDGVTIPVVTISNADFVNSNTGFTTVSRLNSIASWATVLTAKLPGITVTATNGRLRFTSNRGASAGAAISVDGGTLAEAIFDSLPVAKVGSVAEFQFDPNLGQILLADPLQAGDSLTVGTQNPRAAIVPLSSTPTLAATAEAWFVVDGDFTFPETGIGIGTATSWSATSPAWGQRVALTIPSAFSDVLSGDWIVITDAALPAGLRGAFRLFRVDANTIHIERSTFPGAASYTLTEGGITIVRSETAPQKVSIAAGTYTATSLAAALTVTGARAEVVDGVVRLTANNPEGRIAVVGLNTTALDLFAQDSAINSDIGVSGVVSGGVPMPSFGEAVVITTGGTTTFTTATDASPYVTATFLGADRDSANNDRPSNQKVSTEITNGTTALTVSPAGEWLVGNRLFFGRGYEITARDVLSVGVDGTTYSVPMARPTTVVSSGGTWTLSETDATSLAKTFGTGFDWTNFGVAFRSRTKTHSSPDTDKSIVWRWWRYGPDGDDARIQYQYPKAASAGVSVESLSATDIVVRLGSGSEIATPNIRTTTKIGYATTSLAAGLYTHQFVGSLAVSAASRVLRINYINRGATVFSGTVTGGASLATATVVSDSNGPGAAASGWIVVTGVAGFFQPGETLTGTAGAALSNSGTYGYTTLTLTLPGAVTNHGISASETIYFTPGDANFLAGAKTLSAVTATTVSYVDSVATTAAGGAIGSVSVDTAGEVTIASVATGNIFSAHSATAFGDDVRVATKVTVAAGSRSWSGAHTTGSAVSTTLTWRSPAGSQFFALTANTAAQIATAVNALADLPVTASAVGTAGVGTATGVVSAATFETTELGGVSPWWNFSDGFNWVRSHTTPATTSDNFVFTLRNSLATTLTSNADATSEAPYLVPVTARSISSWLGSQVSGVGAKVVAGQTRDGRVWLESKTVGSGGTMSVVQSTAGTAVRGTGEALSGGVQVATDAADGVGGLQWVWAQNAVGDDKSVFDDTTVLDSLSAAGVAVFGTSGPNVWTRIGSLNDNQVVYIERQGPLVALHPLVTTSVVDGDALRLQSCTAVPSGTTQLSVHNAGLFTVVKVSGNTVWIENDGAVEQLAGLKYDFISRDSALPGDTIVFGDTTWGDNVGSRLVTALGGDTYTITLDTSTPITPVTAPATLGASAPAFRVVASPAKTLRRVSAVNRTATGLSLLLTPSTRPELLSEGLGTTLAVAGKLAFDGQTAQGEDGYRYNTGLLKEVAKIVYGDEFDTLTYPGVAAAGASYRITGPVTRRIKVALAVRCSTHTEDKRREIQSAVAGAINSHVNGRAVALSVLASAAQRVPGVISVRVVNPNPNTDLIPVLSYEKAQVYGLDNISITFVGE